jgi:Tol biopolymer transport system component
MKKYLLTLGICFASTLLFAQQNARWLRYPAISPDGQTIAFGYLGNIYKIDAQGGTAVPVTVMPSHEMMPVWSHDGKTLAFSSDQFGNFDVFTMPAEGGIPKRITYYSADDYAYDFTPDNRQVLVGSGRNAPAQSVRFPSPRLFRNLYKIPASGGRPLLVSAAGADDADFNSTGSQIVFQDRKGYEDAWRKHHTSSVTRDIWLYDLKKDSYTKLSDFKGENREPLFSNDDQSVFYLNEKDGTQNLYKRSLASGQETQLTTFKDFPVRHLSLSENGVLCFSWKGDIYTLTPGSEPQKVSVQVANDGNYSGYENMPITGGATEFALSPNGKEIAFVKRGEVFVTGVDDARTKRITNTPEQERMLAWSPDGKTLLFSAERGESWDIYKTTLTRPEEKYFYASTVLKQEPIRATDAEEFQPEYSPDGKKVAFVEERNILKVLDLDSKKTTTILPEGHNYSYSDGDWSFDWSPDSQWLMVDDQKGYFFATNTALIKADGSGDIIYPVNSGFGEANPKWGMGGKMMTYMSSKEGRKSLANQGSREYDIYGVFFNQEAYDTFTLSKEEYELYKERQDKDGDAKKEDSKKAEKEEEVKPLKLNFEQLDHRKVKLTINSSSLSDYALTKDGSKLYYLASFEKGYDLWVTEPRTYETKILAKLGGSPGGIEISKDEKSLFVSNNGTIVQVNAESGKISPVKIDGEMVLNAAGERAYIFEHAWRQVKKKFYDPDLHGVKWGMYRTEYGKFLPYINNNYDFQELLSELLGELNGSHTGGRYSPRFPNGDKSASFGLLYDETYAGAGIKVTEVLAGGPLDNATNKIKAGDIIQKINGNAIEPNTNWNKLMLNKQDKNTLLTIKPAKGSAFEETLKPISTGAESGLMYQRWVKTMDDMVTKMSGGKVGYVHIRGMNDASFRDMYDKVMGEDLGKEALIVDTRFNGGGWLHDDLNTFLSGKQYLKFAPQGHVLKGGEPMDRWQKPSCVLMSQSNYSDAFIFPYIYKENGIGKLIGMPVPGTGTAVWWERQIDPTIVFGIPMVGTIGAEGWTTENHQVEPDIRVPLPYKDFLSGKDPQLAAGVKEMLKEAADEK